ncbi:MAG: hypothetical protein VB934_08055, partial [Polyangiaceae bacterium]
MLGHRSDVLLAIVHPFVIVKDEHAAHRDQRHPKDVEELDLDRAHVLDLVNSSVGACSVERIRLAGSNEARLRPASRRDAQGRLCYGCRLRRSTMDAEQIVELCKRHTVFPWAAQGKINPLTIDRAKGIYFWDKSGKR